MGKNALFLVYETPQASECGLDMPLDYIQLISIKIGKTNDYKGAVYLCYEVNSDFKKYRLKMVNIGNFFDTSVANVH